MRQVTIYTTNKKYDHFVQLAKNLNYVKKIETDEGQTKEEIIDNLKKGFEEMKLIIAGKKNARNAEDFLNSL